MSGQRTTHWGETDRTDVTQAIALGGAILLSTGLEPAPMPVLVK